MVILPEDSDPQVEDYWFCTNCGHKLLYSEWLSKREKAADKVGRKTDVSIKWDEKTPGRLLIVSQTMNASRLNGTRRPKPLGPEQRFEVEQDLREEIEKITGTSVSSLNDYLFPQ
jgi:DNA-directed RNA polymerase subunit RPC12/RpoP